MSYRRLSKKPSLFRSFTGLTVSEFNLVCKEIEHNYEEFGIMGTKFRNRLKRYNNASDIVSGLVNLRVMQSNRISP
ncbi:MAG: hypothetical protein WAK17_13515 [Candidatus Nitrosopolaris sp.]